MHKRSFGPDAQQAFLAEAHEWRKRCVLVMSRAPVRGPVYLAASGILDAIDGLAEVVTGDRRHFATKPHSTHQHMAIPARDENR